MLNAYLPTNLIPSTLIPTAAARGRSVMVAVVLGTALAGGSGRAAARGDHKAIATAVFADEDAVADLSRYCQACWRNARVSPDLWADCTQQVLVRMLERVPADRWAGLLRDDGDDRKEFVRAIDTVKKRTQRAKKHAELTPDVADFRNTNDEIKDRREAVAAASKEVLSERQQRILQLTADGWAVPDIASDLNTTVERVSDEKYKAIRKLRTHFGVDA